MKKINKYIKLNLCIALILCMETGNVNAYAEENSSFKRCSEVLEISTTKDESSNAIIKEKVISYSNKYVSTNIYKPIVVLENKEIEGRINTKISKVISSFEENIKNISEKDNEFYIANKLDPKQYVIFVNYIVTYNSDNILSLTLSLYSYLGGAHGGTTDISFNFDTRTGNNGSIKDFFGNNSTYKDIILNNIKKTVAANPDMYFKDVVDKLNDIPYNQKFYLTKDSLIVYFDEYAIAPYVAGRVEFKIPYSEFQNGINKDYVSEEAPVIQTIAVIKKGRINEYITYPHIENLRDIEVQKNLNDKITEEINNFVEVMKSRSEDNNLNSINGITVYYVPLLKEKDELILKVIYYGSDANEEKVFQDNRNYIINLNTGEVN